MPTPHAQINPAMLRWARGRMGMDIGAAAIAAGVKPEQLERWETGAICQHFGKPKTLPTHYTRLSGSFSCQKPRRTSRYCQTCAP